MSWSDCLFDCLGCLCGTLAVLKIIGAIWCVYDLRRKSVPELWGIDWLDILYRLEREFGVAFERGDFAAIPAEVRVELTAGQLWDLVAAKLRNASRPVPGDGWERVVGALSEALNVKSIKVRRESRLYKDLGMIPDTD